MQVSEIHFKLKQSKLYWDLRRKLMQSQGDLAKFAQSNEIEGQLRKLIMNQLRKTRKLEPIKNDDLDFMNLAKAKWTDLLYRNLEIVYQMSKHQEEDETSRDSKIYIYDDKNLINFIINIKPSAFQIPTRSLSFSYTLDSTQSILDKYRYALNEEINEDKMNTIRRNIEYETLGSELERLCMGPVPNGERVQLYLKYFEIENTEALSSAFNKLIQEPTNPFYDELLEIDTHEIGEDSFYFVFSEQIQLCLKCFMRDKSCRETISIILHTTKSTALFQYPQCGLLPFKHLARYVAPFCYLSTKNHIIYYLFKEFFCRYFCFLHAISSHPNSVISLVLKFDDAFANLMPKLYHHIKLIVDPLKLLFPYMVTCFVGTLEPQHVLQILDKVIAHNSFDILIILALGVLNKYKGQLLLAKTQNDIEEIFSLLRDESFIDLLQSAYL